MNLLALDKKMVKHIFRNYSCKTNQPKGDSDFVTVKFDVHYSLIKKGKVKPKKM